MSLMSIQRDLKQAANPKKARDLARFFKTGKGEYGEGDKFLGIIVPKQRLIAKKFISLNLADLQKLLNSKIHEFRLTALLILVEKYKKAALVEKKKIINFYLKNTKNINNWDLVDLSAPKILGDYLLSQNRKILQSLVKSKNLWEKRISVLATSELIRNHQFDEILNLAKILISDPHDLIHKAVGWMLREVGKRDLKVEEEFLKKYYKIMPRTMLRYAIEKFPEVKRQKYLKNLI